MRKSCDEHGEAEINDMKKYKYQNNYDRNSVESMILIMLELQKSGFAFMRNQYDEKSVINFEK